MLIIEINYNAPEEYILKYKVPAIVGLSCGIFRSSVDTTSKTYIKIFNYGN